MKTCENTSKCPLAESTLIKICTIILTLSLFIGGLYSLYTTFSSLYRIYNCKKWPIVNGRITQSSIQVIERYDEGKYYEHFPIVSYSYTVDKKEYTSSRFNFYFKDLKSEYKDSKSDAEYLVKQYPIDEIIPVYYNPKKPYDTVVEASYGLNWISGILIFFAINFFMILMLYLIGTSGALGKKHAELAEIHGKKLKLDMFCKKIAKLCEKKEIE